MKTKLTIILFLLVVVPLALLVWLGTRLLAGEREASERSFAELQAGKLDDLAKRIDQLLQRRQQQLLRLGNGLNLATEDLRKLVNRDPRIRQLFLLDGDGRLLHPPPGGPLSAAERQFLVRCRQVLDDRAAFLGPSGESRPPADHGWYSWYWVWGINLVLWQRLAQGRILGIELERSRLLADIIAELPDTSSDPGLPARLALLDAREQVIYQWGNYTPGRDAAATASRSLEVPLKPWCLEIHAGENPFARILHSRTRWLIILGLSSLGLGLIALAWYFYRDSSRQLREAGQRVSFVNHVSHELKTPLTNIRMYAELLQDRLTGDDARQRHHLQVVVDEAQRLSRLIDNVLTFSRHQRGQLRLRRQVAVVDEVIRRLLRHHFRTLAEKGITLDFQGRAERPVALDVDVMEQVFYNLLTNAEKYAPGGRLTIRSEQDDERTRITVSDSGPGVPSGYRERVFEPFFRVHSAVSEGASGTGIGLAIARELARLHGGDLRLLAGSHGATFEVTLDTSGETR